VLGPVITEVSASDLVKAGTITSMSIKSLILNHDEKDMGENLKNARKAGAGAEAFRYEKDFIQQSDKRLDFIKKIVDKCDKNTLLLFHTIEYGKKILDKLSKECEGKQFYYIDGEVCGKKREEIKKEMEKNDGIVRVLIASFGTLGTGVSIKNLHFLIMADSFKSEQIIIQSIGRLLRLFVGKEQALIFDLVDVFDDKMDNIFYKHYQERKKFYKKRKYPYKEIKIKL
jgi:superfamily II DNA or RNA helicase